MTSLVRLPRHQHMVSKVILRRFTWRGEMSIYDAAASKQAGRAVVRRKGPDGAFFVEDFVAGHQALEIENRWGAIERALADVLPLVDRRTVLGDQDAVEVLRDVLALHWARSISMKHMHEVILTDLINQSRARLMRRPDLVAAAYEHRMGLVAASESELHWMNDDTHARMPARMEEVWAERMMLNLTWARSRFAEAAVQVGYATDGEFAIGDAPVITKKDSHGGLGVHQGVALMEANTIVMPLGPTVVMGLGAAPRIDSLDAAQVDSLNELQRRAFHRNIGCRPGKEGVLPLPGFASREQFAAAGLLASAASTSTKARSSYVQRHGRHRQYCLDAPRSGPTGSGADGA